MSIKSINAHELKSKIDSKEEFFLIDCREQNEWDAGHIAQANLYCLSMFSDAVERMSDKKNTQIIIQCRSGKRSMNACKILLENGFKNLTNLEGGILAWIEAGHSVET